MRMLLGHDLYITVVRGTNLRNTDKEDEEYGEADPYCTIRVLNKRQTTAPLYDEGQNPQWNQTLIFDNVPSEDTFRDEEVKFDIYDLDKGADELIGSACCTLGQLLENEGGAHELKVVHEANPGTESLLFIESFYDKPAPVFGTLSVTVERGQDLRNTNKNRGFGRADPYTVLHLGGDLDLKKRTHTAAEAGQAPRWNKTLTFKDIAKHQPKDAMCMIDIFDDDGGYDDEHIGKTSVSLLELIEGGSFKLKVAHYEDPQSNGRLMIKSEFKPNPAKKTDIVVKLGKVEGVRLIQDVKAKFRGVRKLTPIVQQQEEEEFEERNMVVSFTVPGTTGPVRDVTVDGELWEGTCTQSTADGGLWDFCFSNHDGKQLNAKWNKKTACLDGQGVKVNDDDDDETFHLEETTNVSGGVDRELKCVARLRGSPAVSVVAKERSETAVFDETIRFTKVKDNVNEKFLDLELIDTMNEKSQCLGLVRIPLAKAIKFKTVKVGLIDKFNENKRPAVMQIEVDLDNFPVDAPAEETDNFESVGKNEIVRTDDKTYSRYLTKTEMEVHNTIDDCWVSVFNRVYDLTNLIREHPTLQSYPIIDFAGQDVSHWLDRRNEQPTIHQNPKTGMENPFLMHGRYLHVAPNDPTTTWDTNIWVPWWKDEQYFVGHLSKHTRYIRVVNVLTGQDDTFEVCSEETLNEIVDRYETYNSHARSYTWKRLGKVLDFDSTLEENKVPDEGADFEELGIDDDFYVPALFIYFNDDLTVA